MKVRRIIIAVVVPLIFVIGTSFLSPADIATKTSPSEPRAEAAYSTGNAANFNTVSSFTPVSPVNSSQGFETIKSKAWDKIESGSRRLTNNVWGAPEDETLISGVYLNYDGSFGWDWNRPDPKTKPGQTCVKPIYPSVRCGGSPWDPSNSAYFPVRLTDIKSLKLDVMYSYPSLPTGSYNLAYDMFLSDTNQPGSSPKPKAEVMIWLHSTFPQLPNTYRGDFTDGNNTYELYSFVMSDGRLYYSFAMKGQPQFQAQHTVDARRLMDNLTLDPNWYIHGVELGNEIVSGSGKIKISKLNISLNGHDVQGKPFWWQVLFK